MASGGFGKLYLSVLTYAVGIDALKHRALSRICIWGEHPRASGWFHPLAKMAARLFQATNIEYGFHPIESAGRLGNDGTMKIKTAFIVLLSALVVIVGLGCNTANGFGKDVSKAGDGIQNGTK